MLVLLITGKPRTGKDTLCSLLSENYIVSNYSMVDIPKKICKFLDIEDNNKSNSYRKLLSDFKIALDEYSNMNLEYIINSIENSSANIVCVQSREFKDIEEIKNRFSNNNKIKVISILVSKESINNISYGNIADDNVSFDTDLVIENNGTLEDFKTSIINSIKPYEEFINNSKSSYLTEFYKVDSYGNCLLTDYAKGLLNNNSYGIKPLPKLPNGVKSIKGMFKDLTNVEYLDLSELDVTEVEDFTSLCENCYNLRFINLKNFKTLKAKYFNSMFKNCFKIRLLDLSDLETNLLESINYMFYKCINLKYINFGSNFDCVNLIDASYAFYGCLELEILNLNFLICSNIKNMDYMCYNCKKLNLLVVDNILFDNCSTLNIIDECYNLNTVSIAGIDLISY